MADIIKRNKALSVSPLKASSSLGAALAFLGIRDTIAMLHGAQGCTAYGKIYLIGHFREPVALQTTAMDQVSTIMGSDENVVEGLKTLYDKFQPALVGIPTTGLSETQGADVNGAVANFRKAHPECFKTAVVPVETPDYVGSLEAGFAKAVYEMINRLVPEAKKKGGVATNRQVNILVNASLTPADIDEIKDMVEAFGLLPIVLPDLSTSLDGHLDEKDFNPLTTGGTCVGDFEILHKASATIVIGASMAPAADLLLERTGVPDHRFDHLMGLEAMDRFILTLHDLTGRPVPKRIERHRQQLQDAMLDTHFNLGMGRAAVAADPDLLKAFSDLLAGMGCELVAAVAPSNTALLKQVFAKEVKIGDLQELEKFAEAGGADLLIGNAHCAASAERLGLPLLRAGFPQYDRMGASSRCWVGYKGSKQTLFDLANLLIETEQGAVEPYRSIYAQVQDREGRAMAQISRMLTLVDGTIDDGFEDGALKIAFATSDQHHVDQHFGTCESFAVYLVTRDEAHFHQSIAFEQAAKDGSEDKLQARIAALEGVAAVYCRAVGASAISQLKQSGVQPIKVKDGTMIKHQLGLFQEELKGDPAFWVLRALESVKGLRDDPRRFDDMETEGWSE